MVESMSRPWLSVPSRYADEPPSDQAGGSFPSHKEIWAGSNGLYGAIKGAAKAAVMAIKVIIAAIIAPGVVKKE